MAGIYIHIPFCKTRCKYCDFFSTTRLERSEEYVAAVCKEMSLREDYLPSRDVETVYVGGGTPSMLSENQLDTILRAIGMHFNRSADAEVTMEANPGDLTEERLRGLRNVGFNRLSIGIQSFHDETLKVIGRRHTAIQAIEAVESAQRAGFDNISIDLIYGLPGQTMDEWKQDVEQAIGLNVQHVSAYCLSYEENTALTKMLQQGLIEETDEEIENAMYDYLVERLAKAGMERYEVSNFSLPGRHSRHNSSYWNATPYLGLGAGAHSYNGCSRQWNIADLDRYIKGVETGNGYWEKEELSDVDRYNELIMLSLRTCAGLPLSALTAKQESYCLKQAETYLNKGMLCREDNRIYATQEGTHLLNRIIEDLMLDKE